MPWDVSSLIDARAIACIPDKKRGQRGSSITSPRRNRCQICWVLPIRQAAPSEHFQPRLFRSCTDVPFLFLMLSNCFTTLSLPAIARSTFPGTLGRWLRSPMMRAPKWAAYLLWHA
jgi:hypothetical protein